MPLSRRSRAGRRRAPSRRHGSRAGRCRRRRGARRSASSRRARFAASSPTPGSSSSHSGRRPASSRARLARRFWPEERKRAGVAASRSRSNQASAGPSAAGPPARPAAKARFSSTESSGLSGSAWPRKCSRARCSGASAEQAATAPGEAAGAGPQEACQQAQQGRLAAAVGAAQHQGVPGCQGEREGLEHETAAAHAGEVVGGKGRGRQGCVSADRR